MYSRFEGGNCRYVGLLIYENVRLIDGYKGSEEIAASTSEPKEELNQTTKQP